MGDLLFVYGTLHPERAPAEIAETVRRLEPVGAATIRGRMLDLGEYPGVLPDEGGTVSGCLFALPGTSGEAAELWAALDAYEGYIPEDEPGSLFVRRKITAIRTDQTQVECWVYGWNGRREQADFPEPKSLK